jgi:hypothetical protein
MGFRSAGGTSSNPSRCAERVDRRVAMGGMILQESYLADLGGWLVEHLTRLEEQDGSQWPDYQHRAFEALREVAQLHSKYSMAWTKPTCDYCKKLWPCPDLTAIARPFVPSWALDQRVKGE